MIHAGTLHADKQLSVSVNEKNESLLTKRKRMKSQLVHLHAEKELSISVKSHCTLLSAASPSSPLPLTHSASSSKVAWHPPAFKGPVAHLSPVDVGCPNPNLFVSNACVSSLKCRHSSCRQDSDMYGNAAIQSAQVHTSEGRPSKLLHVCVSRSCHVDVIPSLKLCISENSSR